MKKFGIRLLVISCLFISLWAYAVETNTVQSLKVSGRYWLTESTRAKQGFAMWPEKVAGDKILRESLPAAEFPEGNWGEVTNGCQVSLRFDKRVFTNGEPIEGTVLVRNMTNQIIYYIYHPSGHWDSPIGFVVTTPDGIKPPNSKASGVFYGGMTYTLEPKTQHKHWKDLTKDYKLTNGVYSVHAEIRTLVFPPPIENGKPKGGYVMVKSAEVPITITNAP